MKGLSLIFALLLTTAPAGAGEADTWSAVAEKIGAAITSAESLYARRNAEEARRAVTDAYFGIFEDSQMEAALRTQIGARHAYNVERRFGNLRKAIKKDKGLEAVREIADDLRAVLRQDAKALDDAGVPRKVFKVNQ